MFAKPAPLNSNDSNIYSGMALGLGFRSQFNPSMIHAAFIIMKTPATYWISLWQASWHISRVHTWNTYTFYWYNSCNCFGATVADDHEPYKLPSVIQFLSENFSSKRVLARNHMARSHASWVHQSRHFIIYHLIGWGGIQYKTRLVHNTHRDTRIRIQT